MTLDERRYRVPRASGVANAARGALADAPALPAQILALGLLLYLATAEGGFYPLDWYPAGLVVLAATALWAAVVPPRVGPRRAAVVAAVLFAAFAAWALLSISWAGEGGVAWDGANRALLYAALFALFALWPTPPRVARWLIALVGVGIAAIGLVELLRWAASADPGSFLIGGRLSQPVGYQNGAVALWLMGAFACLWVAAARELPAPLRGVALGGVPLLASLSWLGQSRGSLFALPLALLIFLAVTPGRLRMLAALVPCALAVAVAVGPGLDVVDAPSEAALPPLVDDAARAILIPAAIVAMLGLLAAVIDRRFTPSPGVAGRVTRVATALVAAVALAAAAVGVSQAGDIRSELSKRWDQFKSAESEGTGSGRLSSGGTNRYNFWVVAWDAFEREPLRGVGMDNFQQEYALRGRSVEKPRYPHSFELAVLSETGLVGAILMFGGLLAAVLAAFAGRRAIPPAARAETAGPAMAALGIVTYLVLHTSVDWLYELPALGGLGFAMLGLAAGAHGSDEGPARRAARSAAAGRVAGAVAAVLAAVSLTLPWLAERQVAASLEIWRAAPDDALERLDRAASLNPVSARPELFEGAIAAETGKRRRAADAYLNVVEREPGNASAWIQLAVLASSRQDRTDARRYAARATALAPRDEAIRELRRRIARGAEISPERARRVILKYARGATE